MPKSVKGFGNLTNRVMESGRDPAPKVGDGVTEMMHSDRHAGTITWVSDSGTTFKFKQDHAKVIKGSTQDGSAEYEYSPNPGARERTARRNSKGQYVSEGSRIVVGRREEYYDPSF